MQLVCPAGSLPALKSALREGADAIYVGFRDDTNARHFAGLNLDDRQLQEGLGLIRAAGRQLYLAVNTYPGAAGWPRWQRAVDHAAELGNEVPKEPLLFLKPPSSLLAPNGIIRMPALSHRVDYEGELAIVIGRRCRNLGPDDDPRPYIRGYTIVNDVTARDIQKSDGQWTRGKGFDTFCPVGPIVSSEIDPASGAPVTVTTRLNGVVKQQGSTRDFIFPIAHLLRYITAAMTLEPGDLIPTGTPAGVGSVQPGDRMGD